jgi:peptidoglycan/xylan/chitin deacetylase (PgdA/CDA1 family)
MTFFVIGPNVLVHPEIERWVLAEWHEIGNHSWTHPQLSKFSDQRVTEETRKTQETIKSVCGFLPRCCDYLTEQSQIGFVAGFGELVGYSLRSVSGYLLAKLSSRDRASAEG